MNVLITGASGYVGSVLTPMFRNAGHRVTAFDTMWFGNHIGKTDGTYRVYERDVRNGLKFPLQKVDALIHLAAVSNDESVEADQVLSRSINLDATGRLVETARALGCERFVSASTSAVYGHSPHPMMENDPCAPVFNYATWKVEAEAPVLAAGYTVVRPAALFGHSPRMRFDLGVNILTAHAACKGTIELWGGDQMRSCLHVHDMAIAYLQLLTAPLEQIQGKVFNVGGENLSLLEIAQKVQAITGAPIYRKDARDARSYQIDSSKWRALFGNPRRTVEDGIRDIVAHIKGGAYDRPLENPIYRNVEWMKSLSPARRAS